MAEKAKAKHAALLVDMEVAELAACFTRYQTAPDLLPIDRIADVFREAGIELNQYRVSQLVSDDMVDYVTLEQLRKMAAAHFARIDIKQELMETFKIFDVNETGRLNAVQFTQILTDMGIESTEIEEFMSEAKVDKKGEIDYTALVVRIAEGETETKKPKSPANSKRKTK